MARVSTYLNFPGNTEEAFEFYKGVFGTEYSAPIFRIGDGPADENSPPIPEHLKNKIMNIQLPITAGHLLMATDMLEEWGQTRVIGNNTTICLDLDSAEELHRLYDALSEGGGECSAPEQMFWALWGTCLDRFGIRWMFNYYTPAAS